MDRKAAEPELRRFYNVLEDKPIPPNDQRYVPFRQLCATDPIEAIRTDISWKDAATVNLLSGQRGSGKTTELLRLQNLLEEDGCVVLFRDMIDYISPADSVEISDLLISLMGALSDAVEERYDVNSTHQGYWARIVHFLGSEVQLDGFDLGATATAGDIGSLSASLRASLKVDPTFRRRLQEKARGHLARLTEDAKNFANDVVRFIRERTEDDDKKIVFIADSLDQIRGTGSTAVAVHRSVADTFGTHAEKLRFDALHIVYTVPPYLPPFLPNLGILLGGRAMWNLPSIHVRNRDGATAETRRDEDGLAIMREIVAKRFPSWEQIFPVPLLDALAERSGGDIREFFRLLRESLVQTRAIPVSIETIRIVEENLRRDMVFISEEDKERLRDIARSKGLHFRNLDELPRIAALFDGRLVLAYRNGENWYDVHPLIEDFIAAGR